MTETETTEGWQPDTALGGDFQARTIPLRPDAHGDVVATLVRLPATANQGRGALLLVHGWADYFLQGELAGQLAELASLPDRLICAKTDAR